MKLLGMMWQILVIAVLTSRGLTQRIFNSNVTAVKTPPGRVNEVIRNDVANFSDCCINVAGPHAKNI